MVEKQKPDVTIAAGMAISIGSVPLHHTHPKEEEDQVAVEDTIEGNVVEDVEGNNILPKEH